MLMKRKEKRTLHGVLTLMLMLGLMLIPGLLPETACATGGNPQKVDGVYQIEDYADLKAFAEIVNGKEGQEADLTACGKLMNDIIAKNSPVDSEYAHDWVPIGTDAKPYIGCFDGDNHIIIGLSNEEQPDVNSADHQGLFGYIGSTGSVENVGLEDGKIRGSYSGGVAGQNAGTITNCYNTGAVSGGDHVAGVAAHNTGTITDCYNTASFASGQVCCGGIAAQNEGTGTITNCHNTGKML